MNEISKLEPGHKSESEKAKNQLIDDSIGMTLSNCADVIDYMAYFNENEAGEPSDAIKHARRLANLSKCCRGASLRRRSGR